jgi:FMN-dependent NADH-azoreductase
VSRLLYIEASPAGEKSTSRTIAQVFLDAWKTRFPDGKIDTLNLWSTQLPELGKNLLAAREAMESGRPLSPDESIAWNAVREVVYRFLAADRLLLATPMWNFGIPYRLKHYIDCLTQPTLTYKGNPEEGFEGTVHGRSATIILSRGGSYKVGSIQEPFDFQQRYLVTWLRFLGMDPVETILVEPTTGDPDLVRSAINTASRAAKAAGQRQN